MHVVLGGLEQSNSKRLAIRMGERLGYRVGELVMTS
jgi:hypothetical protein